MIGTDSHAEQNGLVASDIAALQQQPIHQHEPLCGSLVLRCCLVRDQRALRPKTHEDLFRWTGYASCNHEACQATLSLRGSTL